MKPGLIIILITTIVFIVGGLLFSNNVSKLNEGGSADDAYSAINRR